MIEKTKELLIGGVPAVELAEEYGTPLYVYDAEILRTRYRQLEEAFSTRHENFSISYAVKANFNPEIAELLVEEGAHLDCASPAEIMLAEKLVGTEEIMYTAPYTPGEEIDYAAEKNSTINFDGIYALENASSLPDRVSFRIDPGIGRGDFGLVLGGGDTKFGVPEDRAVEAYRKAVERGAERFGIHMMTGSNVRDPDYFAEITGKLLEIAGEIRSELDIEFEFVDIGGGLGIPYKPGDEPLDVEETAEKVMDAFEKGVEEHGLGNPELRIEPGRFLTAESGVLLTRVTGVRTKQDRTFIGTDTGMHHMIRPMLFDAHHEILMANEPERPVEGEKTVVGLVCSSTDVIAEQRSLPSVEKGEILAIMNAGAYGFSMASHWNTRPLPAEIMVEDGDSRVIRDAEDDTAVFHGTQMFDPRN